MSAAVAAWPRHCPAESREAAAAAARRIALGDSLEGALGALEEWFGDDAAAVAAVARLHAVSGCDAARLLDGVSRSIERRNALLKTASIATSGTKLSSRIVSALPAMILPLVPAAGGSLFDRRGSLLLVCGGLLLLLGAWWITRLLPGPPQGDEAAELAAFVASATAAGVGLRDALHLGSLAAATPLRGELGSSAQRVRLGTDWATALDLSSHEGLRALAGVLRRAERIGSPVARPLQEFAEERVRNLEAAFDEATRRAPVLMVLPLTICILPAYVLLAIGPILRGLSFG